MNATRILLAIDAVSPDQRGLLEAISGLGLSGPLRLQAAFFEDQDLLASATLSCAREVHAGHRPAPLRDRPALEQHLRLKRDLLRRQFMAAARRLDQSAAFRAVPGPAGIELLREAGQQDVLVLGRPGPAAVLSHWMGAPLPRLLLSGPSTIVLVQDFWAKGEVVAALHGGNEDSQASLEVARRIAGAVSPGLRVLELGGAAPLDLVATLRTQPVRSLVVSAELALQTPGLLRGILQHTRASVVICRSDLSPGRAPPGP